MLGMNLPDNDPFTEALLTNEEVLAVNQDALGSQARQAPRSGLAYGLEVWTRELADGSHAVGLFNRLGLAMPITVRWSDLGLPARMAVRDLWQRRDLGMLDGYTGELQPHGAILLRVAPLSRP
jgi:alpha-galactosidase